MLQALFDLALAFVDLAALELAVIVVLLQEVAQVGLAVAFGGVLVGAGDFQCRGPAGWCRAASLPLGGRCQKYWPG